MNRGKMEIDKSNYWDNFPERLTKTVSAVGNKTVVPLERLTVHLTDSCNVGCLYCNQKHSKNTMSFDLARRVVAEYAKLGGKIIHFTGGEPSLVSYFGEICAYSKAFGLEVSANTNLLETMDISNVDKLKVSFDTASPILFNRLLNRRGAFESALQNLKSYSEIMDGKTLSITALLSKVTFPFMKELAQFILDNIKVHNIYFSNYKGSVPDFSFSTSDIEHLFKYEIPETLNLFVEKDQEYSYKQLQLYSPKDFMLGERYPENKELSCYVSMSEMTIDTQGNCYRCSHLYRDGVTSEGSILKDKLGSIHKRMKAVPVTLCSKFCLSGCNPNLIAFNQAVEEGL